MEITVFALPWRVISVCAAHLKLYLLIHCLNPRLLYQSRYFI
jgi:hypothetical protein